MSDETKERLADWDKDQNGDVIALPFAGHATVLLASTGCLLLLQYWASPETIGEAPLHLQVGLSPAQSRALAKSLQRMADAAEGPAPGDLKH